MEAWMLSNVSSRKLSLVWKDIVTMEHRNERMFNLFQENVAFSISKKMILWFGSLIQVVSIQLIQCTKLMEAGFWNRIRGVDFIWK
ncbi:hypothetical protein Acr_11g0009570 [Actinidia rufa]|uniref:Uncharacterized protein n=1 Tax=Actinidia rufa TaxID=165716 RepID=A0A7J0FD88_9ERIC|nr:hypothetical protein Acr_11g0009570 [Actinidia rufa]